MPELPEVETVRSELAPWITGATIVRARRVDAPAGPKYAHLSRCEGALVRAVERRGKFLVLPLVGSVGDRDELVVHLGMTGVITPERPDSHVRVQLDLEGVEPKTLYFRDVRRFGRFLVAPDGDYSGLPTLKRMGPEPLGDGFGIDVFADRMRSRAPVKSHLLSQVPVAGLGNIYVDEVLWQVRVHPQTRACDVSRKKLAGMRDAIVSVLEAAVRARGTTLSDYRTVSGGTGGYGHALAAYGRHGQPCLRCETLLKRITVGQRSTHFCSRCQRRKKATS